jgi:DNA-binding transcriptional ArsR family regulator
MPSKDIKKANAEAETAAERLLSALADKPESTVADIAAVTGLGRSTIGKQLTELERAGQATRTPGQREGGRRIPDRWSPATAERLRPGQLDGLVLDYVRSASEPVGPVNVARALGRSNGAVANCLARRTKAGDLKQVNDHPRRYRAA